MALRPSRRSSISPPSDSDPTSSLTCASTIRANIDARASRQVNAQPYSHDDWHCSPCSRTSSATGRGARDARHAAPLDEAGTGASCAARAAHGARRDAQMWGRASRCARRSGRSRAVALMARVWPSSTTCCWGQTCRRPARRGHVAGLVADPAGRGRTARWCWSSTSARVRRRRPGRAPARGGELGRLGRSACTPCARRRPLRAEAGARPVAPRSRMAREWRSSSGCGRVIVDGNNVIGSRPDGWWRDRAGATRGWWSDWGRGAPGAGRSSSWCSTARPAARRAAGRGRALRAGPRPGRRRRRDRGARRRRPRADAGRDLGRRAARPCARTALRSSARAGSATGSIRRSARRGALTSVASNARPTSSGRRRIRTGGPRRHAVAHRAEARRRPGGRP